MKKRILSFVLAMGMILSSLPSVVASGKERVYHTWSVAGDFLGAVSGADGDVSMLEFGAFSFTPNHYGNTAIGSVIYSPNGYSSINTAGHTQAWRAQMQIPNNQGTGTGYNNKGVIIRNVRPQDTQKVTFTAPVHGVYNFVPQGIGGAAEKEESVALSSGSMAVSVIAKGENKGTVSVDSDTPAANLPEIKNIELQKGEKIEVTFTPITASDVSNAANAVYVNFKVQITDEIAPQVLKTELKTDSFDLVEEYSLTNSIAAVPQANGIFSVGYSDATGESGSVLDTAAKPALYHSANGYTWYYGKYAGDEDYGIMVDADDNTIRFYSKYQSMHGFIITAERTGKYTLNAGKIQKGGAGAMNLIVEDSSGNKLFSSGGASDGFSVTTTLKKGEKLYVFADRTQTNWSTAYFTMAGLTLDVVYTTKTVPAVNNITKYSVSEELRKNTVSWDTAYEDASSFTYSGILSAVAVETGSLAMTDAMARVYEVGDYFSNANQSYNNNTMMANTDGSMQWVYDYGSYRMGFKFTSDVDAEYILSSAAFNMVGINVYIYKLTDGELVQVGTECAVSSVLGLNISFGVSAGETFIVTLGKAEAGWNNVKDCTTMKMELIKKVVVSPEREEEIVLEYIDDPNYEYVYKILCNHEYDDENDIDCNICGEERPAPYKPEFYISSAEASAGQTVSVILSVKGVKARALTIKVGFDKDVLEAIGGEELKEVGYMSEINPQDNANERGIYSYSMISLEDTDFPDGELLKLNFRVKEGTPVQKTEIIFSDIILGYAEGSHPFEKCKTENGEVNVLEKSVKLGDIDENGSVNIIDVQKLFVMVANGNEVDVLVGDFDTNGMVNIIDVQKLFVAVANGQMN